MAVLKLSTPGVYVQEVPALPPSVAEVETAIPAFIGYTQKADKIAVGDLIMMPTKISSLSEFEQLYGGPAPEADDSVTITVNDLGNSQYEIKFAYDDTKKSKYNLHYSLKSFFANGGGTCFIVAVDTFTIAAGAVKADDLNAGLDKVKDVDEVTLLVVPEAPNIDTTDAAKYKTVVQKMINQASDPDLRDRFALIDPYKVTLKSKTYTNTDLDKDIAFIRDSTAGAEKDRYAAAYYPNIITTFEYAYNFDNLKIGAYTLVAGATASMKITATDTMSKYAGSVFYNKVKDELKKQYVVVPPSGAIAGVYSRVDSTKGVWKAPANEVLYSVVGPDVDLSDIQQQNLNIDPTTGKSVNVIRTSPGFGTYVWGARTLNGNDNEWRYINVRRLFIMIEESIKKSIRWAVFEPNDVTTWVRVRAMIENYLTLKWSDGALQGAKKEDAFYVKVGLGAGQTMTPLDVLEGRMVVEIGIAAVRPAEFIVLRFIQLMPRA